MFRIRRIYDNTLPVNKNALEQIKVIITQQFQAITEKEISELYDYLINPVKYHFRSIIFVAEDSQRTVKGFAYLMHYHDLNFCFLDFISTAKFSAGRGIGSALYERVREEALSFNSIGIFLECLPDDPVLCPDPVILKENKARLRFYEYYGVRPIINTKYETPLGEEKDNPPYLLFDNLGKNTKLNRELARLIITAILERKYAGICPPSYNKMVVESVKDDPVQLRPPRYIKKTVKAIPLFDKIPVDKRIALIINDKHHIHHVREKGFIEAPIRIKRVWEKLQQTGMFTVMKTKSFPIKHITEIHDRDFVSYVRKISETLKPGTSVYPYVFPIRNPAHPPVDIIYRAGYYCIDTFTPLNANIYLAAKRAVDSVLTAAESLTEGYRLSYALVRPPGHHAERRSFGGFCYFNSAAAGAQFLCRFGKVAMLDIDYHHGNGQQDIFYHRPDIFTISIHGHPNYSYPFFSGFRNETGAGPGAGFNLNIPLPENITNSGYKHSINIALKKIKKFSPEFVIVLLGFDTAKGDPTGTWNLEKEDFKEIGKSIGSLKIPIVVVQEGGYNTRNIGINALHFFSGLREGAFK
ncbi:MAG: histone deacetylase family protein [Spirochaetales bacterium]|nr:histone deacetylase family protein [Spirochaetales bacterium]